MQAAILSHLGSLKHLSIQEFPAPQPESDEALIKIEYCGLNHLDILIIEGRRPGPRSFPHIPGSEFVGKIVKINSRDDKWKIGDRVAVYPWTFCGRCHQCRNKNENICDFGGTFGRTRGGGFGEFAAVPIKNLIKIPYSLSSQTVCASILSSVTAFHMIKRAGITDNSPVLITGASGGVGTTAIQLLRNKKCKIICTTSHQAKIKKLKELGADYVVRTDNLLEEVKKIKPSGVEYVIDIMGGKVWSDSINVLAKNGTLVYCSTTLEEWGQLDIASSFNRQLNILGSYGGTIKDLQAIILLLNNGIFKPVIDSVYPMEKTVEALNSLAKQKVFGKILIEVAK